MAYLFIALFIVLPLTVLAVSVSRTFRQAQRGEVDHGSHPASRWGDRVGPTLREHQRLAVSKERPSPFGAPPEVRLVAGKRPALGAVPARVKRDA